MKKRIINTALAIVWYLFIFYVALSVCVIIVDYDVIDNVILNLEAEVLKYDVECFYNACQYSGLIFSIKKIIVVSLNVFNIFLSLEIIFLSTISKKKYVVPLVII